VKHSSIILPALLALCCFVQQAAAGTLVVESWRADDKELWDTVLIPTFRKKYPGIEIRYQRTAPTEYDAAVQDRLANNNAGDLITCRPFDVSQALYRKHYLEKLDGKPGMENFAASALTAWQSEDASATFCMPIASVIHGFLYNKKIFKKLNLQVPRTEAEFMAVLDTVKKNGAYVPLALGTEDKWEATQTLFANVGPNFWRGEEGRKALARGKAKFTDAPYVAALDFEAGLTAYLPPNANTQTYSDSQRQFASGLAAIYPAGSWDLSYFNKVPGLEFGVFAPPVKNLGDQCYILDHMDIGIGINRKSRNKEDAYRFLEWVGSQEFADLYSNRATGFFSLSNHLIAVRDPIAKQMTSWRTACKSTIRIDAQVLNSGRSDWEHELWDVNASVLNGKLSGAEAARQIQEGFASRLQARRK
jgi:raffinose/stachyose/melibiose transport system substrate-binding protein